MSCGKKPLRKLWEHPRNIRVITPSRYEANEASVKVHWKKVMHDLEQHYKDDQFWDTQASTVKELVGPVIFKRIEKIFSLPQEEAVYIPPSEKSSIVPSETVYKYDVQHTSAVQQHADLNSRIDMQLIEETVEEEEESEWDSTSTIKDNIRSKTKVSKISKPSIARLKSVRSKSFSKSGFVSKTLMKSISKIRSFSGATEDTDSMDESAHTDDDVIVNRSEKTRLRFRRRFRHRNPHFELLYCNESETDMITWKSKYKQKTFEISASDEFSKKAEIMTKMIANDFFDWWTGLGNVEFKSEIRRPEDIEELFQVWFDEHASRGLVLHPKILPCVLQNIAEYVGVPQASCPYVLRKQVAYDIRAETSPAKKTAFDSSLPGNLVHIPPKNNTKKQWRCVKIPQDLKTMACVWEDISHLTSTKAFQRWLSKRPQMPMPKFMQTMGEAKDTKPLFVVPSDFVVKDGGLGDTGSAQELALPVSQFSIELKAVLSKLMNP